MKTTIQINLILIALTQVLSVGKCESIKDYVIGLSPHYKSEERQQIERSVRDFVLSAAKGSRIRCDDAFNLQTISVFSVPDLEFDSPALRMRAIASPLLALSQWFKKSTTGGPVTVLSRPGQLHVPEYLDFVAGTGNSEERSILLVGSPLAEYPSEPSFSMTGSSDGPSVPSDGHLLAGLESSPYGTKERKGRLRGVQISWCYGNERVWSNGLHKTLVTRFWGLFAKQLDATLTAFTPDLAGAIAALPRLGLPAVANFDLNPEDTKIEMRIARPRQVPTWLPQAESTPARTLPSPGPAAPERPVVPTGGRAPAPIPSGVSQPQAQPNQAQVIPPPFDISQPIPTTVDIGIMWSAVADVDLYVRPRPGAQELWFQKVRTPEGSYLHDWTSPNNATDFEWVKLNPGARLDQVDAWVNLFKGRGPISGRVAVHFQNRVYTGSFTITATFGNGGQNPEARQSDPHWLRLDLQKILTQTQ